jgi:hypothetical protein
MATDLTEPDLTYGDDWNAFWIRWDAGNPDWPPDEFVLKPGESVEIRTRAGDQLTLRWPGGKTLEIEEHAD